MRQWWKEHGRKWAFRLCGLALAAAVAVSLLPEAVVVPASAVTQAEIDAMREEANSLKQQQEEIQDQAGLPGGGSRANAMAAQDPAGAADQRHPGGDQYHCRPDRQIRRAHRPEAGGAAVRRRRRNRPSTSCSASGCGTWRSRGRSPTGPFCSPPRTLRTCWTTP